MTNYQVRAKNILPLMLSLFLMFALTSGQIALGLQEDTGLKEGMQTMNLALEKMRSKDYPEALELFLQCLDRAPEYGPSFSDIKNSFLMIYLKKMINYYPPTEKELVDRFMIITNKVKSGKVCPLETDCLLELADTLEKKDELIIIYDIAKKNITDDSSLKFLVEELYPILYQNNRYLEIYENMDLLASAKDLVNRWNELGKIEPAKKSIRGQLLEYKVILESLKDIDKAKEIEKLNAVLDQ